MIQASELRIGNYLQDTDGKVFKVNSNEIYNLDMLDSDASRIFRSEGVSLTEEILKKCGFKQRNGFAFLFQLSLPTGFLQSDTNTVWHCITVNGTEYETLSTELEQLHQLQNLYFALVGEELNVSL